MGVVGSGVLTSHRNVRAGELLHQSLLEAVHIQMMLSFAWWVTLAQPLHLYVMGLHLNEGSGIEWGEGGWSWGSSQQAPRCGYTRLSHKQGP